MNTPAKTAQKNRLLAINAQSGTVLHRAPSKCNTAKSTNAVAAGRNEPMRKRINPTTTIKIVAYTRAYLATTYPGKFGPVDSTEATRNPPAIKYSGLNFRQLSSRAT